MQRYVPGQFQQRRHRPLFPLSHLAVSLKLRDVHFEDYQQTMQVVNQVIQQTAAQGNVNVQPLQAHALQGCTQVIVNAAKALPEDLPRHTSESTTEEDTRSQRSQPH